MRYAKGNLVIIGYYQQFKTIGMQKYILFFMRRFLISVC